MIWSRRLLIFLSAIATCLPPASGAEPADEAFARAIMEITRHSEGHAGTVGDLIDEARRYAEETGSTSMRIRVAAAAAPHDAMLRGYLAVRKELSSLLGDCGDQPDRDELMLLLRIALSNIARRHGDYEFAFRQLATAVRFIATTDPDKISLGLVQGLLFESIQVLHGFPGKFPAFDILQLMEATGGMEDPFWRPRIYLMQARMAAFDRDRDRLRYALERFSAGINEQTEPFLAKSFWLIKAYSAFLEGSPVLAEEYLATARTMREKEIRTAKVGSSEMLEALLARRKGLDPAVIVDLLDKARQAYTEEGSPANYQLALSIILHPQLMESPGRIEVEWLEALAHYRFRVENLYPAANGHLAQAILHRKEGAFGNAIEAVAQSMRLHRHSRQIVDDLQLAYHDSWNWFFRHQPAPEPPLIDFYFLVVVLLLVMAVLLLLLRIRTQRLINESLQQSVENSILAERAADQANRLKSQFMSNVSHELKTPLSGVVGMASILDEQITDPHQRKYLKTIRECSRNLLVIVNDLLDLGRMETGRIEIERVPFNVRDMLQYCQQVVIQEAQSKGLTVEAELDPEVPQLLIGDATRIGQVLTNILNNAVRFTREGGVTLSARYLRGEEGAGMLELSVRDTGPGIDPEKTSLIFEPFEQGTPRNRVSEGSGLGLAICRKLVEMMNGRISATSELGKGSVFTVSLPLPEIREEDHNEKS